MILKLFVLFFFFATSKYFKKQYPYRLYFCCLPYSKIFHLNEGSQLLWLGKTSVLRINQPRIISNELCARIHEEHSKPPNATKAPFLMEAGNLENSLTNNRIEPKSCLTLGLEGKHLNTSPWTQSLGK